MKRPEAARRPDGELVAAVLRGEHAAFDDLYRAHAGAVLTVARSHVRDADTAADIVQDTFVRALQNLGNLREADRFRPWLLSIARHAAVDRLRMAKRETALGDDHADALESSDAPPAELAELTELADRVQGCISALSQRDATAVALVTHLGFSPAQVGAALGVTPGAAKVIVHRARRRLRTALVLELLVQQPDLGCSEFGALLATDPDGANRHLESCDECTAAVQAELVPAQRAGAEPSRG